MSAADFRVPAALAAAAASRFADAAQDRLDPLDQQPLGKRLGDEVVGAHLQAEQFVDFLVLGRQEDDRKIGFLAQAAQEFHTVHARHLDVEDRQLRRTGEQAIKRGSTVGVGLDLVPFCFQRNGNGSQNVPVVIDKCNRLHRKWLHQ